MSGVAALAIICALAVSFIHFRETPPDPPKPVRFQLAPENVTIGSINRFALSPDGTKLAFSGSAIRGDGSLRLWIRAMDTLESRPLSATDLTNPSLPFFWSFDSRFVVFQSGGKLKKIDVSGGPAQTLCDVTGNVVEGTWNREGVIVFGYGGVGGPLMRVSSEGGAATPITTLNPAWAETAHSAPVFLPDGRHFLYLRSGKPESTGIYIGSLDDKPGQPASKRLLATAYAVQFVSSPDGSSGEILLLREGTLLAQPFDLRRLELAGEAVPLAEQVASYFNVGQFSASRSGALVYRSVGAAAGAKLTWFDRQGKTLGTPSDGGYTAALWRFHPTVREPPRHAEGRRAKASTSGWWTSSGAGEPASRSAKPAVTGMQPGRPTGRGSHFPLTGPVIGTCNSTPPTERAKTSCSSNPSTISSRQTGPAMAASFCSSKPARRPAWISGCCRWPDRGMPRANASPFRSCARTSRRAPDAFRPMATGSLTGPTNPGN